MRKTLIATIILSLISGVDAKPMGSGGSSRGFTARSVSPRSYSAPPANTGSYTRQTIIYRDNNPSQYHSQQSTKGHSTTALIGAAAAGALAGHLMTDKHGGTSQQTNYYQGGRPAAMNDSYDGSNSVVMPSVSSSRETVYIKDKSSDSTAFIWLFILCSLAAFYFLFFYKKRKQDQGKMIEDKEIEIEDLKKDLDNKSIGIFCNFQEYNRPSGCEWIKANSTEIFYNSIKNEVMKESETKVVSVLHVENRVNFVEHQANKIVGSVTFDSVVSEDGTDSTFRSEWTFIYQNGKWLVSGFKNA